MSDARGLFSAASEKSICESGRSASRLSSRRCLSLMGVVKSTLAGARLSCRDDTDFFFTVLFLTGVNYEHDRDTAGAADGMPALLINVYIRNCSTSIRVVYRRPSAMSCSAIRTAEPHLEAELICDPDFPEIVPRSKPTYGEQSWQSLWHSREATRHGGQSGRVLPVSTERPGRRSIRPPNHKRSQGCR